MKKPLVIALGVDTPGVRMSGRYFDRPLEIIAQPTYGRVLFTSHDCTVIRDCAFEVSPGAAGLTLGVGVSSVMIECCRWSDGALAI